MSAMLEFSKHIVEADYDILPDEAVAATKKQILDTLAAIVAGSYSIHIKNPIFILGFSLNTLIYIRNLHLIYNSRAQKDTVTTIAEAED